MNAMNRTAIGTMILLAVALMIPEPTVAQDLHPSRRPSPLGMAQTFVGDTYVKVTYSRPYKRGRENIFGEGEGVMHAYGDVWRFGANEPTEITVSGPVMVGGNRLEAGTYSIFAVPGEDTWTLHFNDMRGGGAEEYDASKDLAVVEVEATEPAEEVDQFTITLEEADKGVHMVTTWLDFELRVPITAPM